MAIWLSVRLRSKWLWVRVSLLSFELQLWRLLQARSSLTFRQIIDCGSTLKLVRDMMITYSQMYRTNKNSHYSSIIWPVWLNGWVYIYEVSDCGFEFWKHHLNLRYGTLFEQGVPWHSGKLQSLDSLWNSFVTW